MAMVRAIDVDSAQKALRAEMVGLRQSLLPMYLKSVAALFGLWLLWIAWQSSLPDLMDVAWAALGAAGYLSYRVQERHFLLAACVLLVALIGFPALLVMRFPSDLAMAVGVLVVIVANAVLGVWHSLLVALVSPGVLLLAAQQSGRMVISPPTAVLLVLLHALTWGAVVIAYHPFSATLDLAMAGWDQLRGALSEARQRRGELHRVVRALEEATYRIERMNNELILARQQAEVARANKARFAATVSHELRGPLNLVLGFSRLMALSPERYSVPLPAEYHADVDTIYSSSRHLVSLLDDVLDLSQVEAEHMPLVKGRVDLAAVLREAIRVVRPLVERKGLYLRARLNGPLPTILADRVRLRQVMLNLLTNAVRFTQRGGITVGVEEQVGHLRVDIQDTGRGIPSQDLPRLFEEFSQLHLDDSSEGKGTGLGLAISKHLIELHGGTIWGESEEGVGTTFYFTVPLPETTPASPQRLGRAVAPVSSRPHDVCLVLHKDAAIVRLLARYLQSYHVVGIPDERELLPLVRGYYPRAVVTTTAAAERVHESLSGAGLAVPVISCSMPQLTQETHIEGALSYLIKPVTQEMIAATIRQVQCDGEEMHVLIVDDDPDAVRLMEIMLDALPEPCRALRAYDGHTALQIMRDVIPDLVLMDLLMPGLDGERTIAAMRADQRLSTVPVVVVSARDSVEGAATLGTQIGVREAS